MNSEDKKTVAEIIRYISDLAFDLDSCGQGDNFDTVLLQVLKNRAGWWKPELVMLALYNMTLRCTIPSGAMSRVMTIVAQWIEY